jgi:hypothetical protein
MTGFKSKKTAALDEDGMYLVHQTASYADNLGKSIAALGKQTVKDIEQLNAQPAQEPVAWVCFGEPGKRDIDFEEADINGLPIGTLLYTAPPATQPKQEPWRESASDYERGVIDGRQMQAQSSVDKAVNAMTQRPWVGLTYEDCDEVERWVEFKEEGSDRIPI